MEQLKTVAKVWLGIAVLAAVIITPILLFIVGVKLAAILSPVIIGLAGLLLISNLTALVFVENDKYRLRVGAFIYLSAFIYGVTVWVYSLAVAFTLGGWLAVIIGLLLGGVGIIPIAMVVALFSGQWLILLILIALVLLTYASRVIGRKILAQLQKPGKAKARQRLSKDIIEGEVVED